ncbi:hypothetical protein TRFO_27316 [Tritrichomonas foetus]|uniref:Uncharacterized protein n=1 Tax=Tritrichomonas foetus TaxID=1144522 RepID=A0A1J4K0Q3_9EUKA|nr:hypothetical protein TRFO_27316 [Tritrichomonas foetus]|eukprot:OHT05009.1 hypothetical protein TRFO_27316 [Tritrichomonas foetus]
MISLRRLLASQPPPSNEIYESWPSDKVQVFESDFIPSNLTTLEHISRAIKSRRQPLIIWALSNFAKAATNDKKCLQLLPNVLSFLNKRNIYYEYATCVCLMSLSKNLGKTVAAPLLSTIQNRLLENPAIEYIQILKILIPYLTPETIDCCIIPMITRFFDKADEFHFAGAELIISLPLEALHITTDIFLKFLNSRVVIDNYLIQLIKSASQAFSADWCGKILPAQLLQYANNNPALRCGILKTALSLSDIFQSKLFYSYITSAFSWAQYSDDVAIILVLKADEIVTPKTVELFPKMKELLHRISQSKDPRIRVHLPKIISCNPSVFLGNDMELQPVFTSLATDKIPEIRLAFLDSFLALFNLSKNQMSRETLFSLFIPFFDDQTPLIRDRLCSSIIYSTLGAQRLYTIMPHFISFSASIERWRSFSEILKTFLSWSNEIIRTFWGQMAPVVNQAAEKWPYALAQSIQSFYNRVSIIIDIDSMKILEDIVITSYAKSDNYRLRELFPRIAGSFCFQTQKMYIVMSMWTKIVELSKNDIISIKSKIIPQLIKFRQYFIANSKPALEKEVISLYMDLGKEENVYLKGIWQENWKVFNVQMRSTEFEVRPVEQSRSLYITKKDLPGPMKSAVVIPSASETVKASSTQTPGALSLQCHKLRTSRVVFSGQTRGKPLFRKTTGDSKLPSINFPT